MPIVKASPAEHLEGANYVVTINSRWSYAAETPAEVWRIIGEQPFGSCRYVDSPVGLDCSEFIPF